MRSTVGCESAVRRSFLSQSDFESDAMPQCGKSAREIEDPQVEALQFESKDRIGGTLSAKATCATCGAFSASLAINIEVQVPAAHRKFDHELEIDLEQGLGSSATKGFPPRSAVPVEN